ncbi:MAG: P1 family peptidase [Hyphomicrobiales bacterium]
MTNISIGKRNLISDVDGITIGNISNQKLKSGVTAIVCDEPTIASVHVMGGAPGTRDTELLSPENIVDHVDGLVLSGGSAFGIDAGAGAMAAMQQAGRGFEIGDVRVPITPAAILFDLLNGGDKDWGRYPPYREMGFDAVQAADVEFELGSVGAGTGALAANCKGGLGSASSIITFEDGQQITIGAIVAANPLGSPLVGESNRFWAAPFEMDDEFGGLGIASPFPANAYDLRIKGRDAQKSGANTTIAVIATDACLTTSQAKRLAVASHDGFARAIYPSHTPLDGDLIFALATGKSGVTPDVSQQIDLGAIAANTMSRAIARGIYAARKAENDVLPAWNDLR